MLLPIASKMPHRNQIYTLLALFPNAPWDWTAITKRKEITATMICTHSDWRWDWSAISERYLVNQPKVDYLDGGLVHHLPMLKTMCVIGTLLLNKLENKVPQSQHLNIKQTERSKSELRSFIQSDVIDYKSVMMLIVENPCLIDCHALWFFLSHYDFTKANAANIIQASFRRHQHRKQTGR